MLRAFPTRGPEQVLRRPHAVALLVLAAVLGLAPAGTGASAAAGGPPAWVLTRLAAPGSDLVVLFGTTDHAAGRNRVSFAVVRRDNRLVQAPTAAVYVGRADSAAPTRTQARLVPPGPHSHPRGSRPHDHPDETDLYVASIRFPVAGRYWIVVEPAGASVQAYGLTNVRRRTLSPPVGTPAIATDNPTLRDAPAEKITTARPPDVELLRHSVAGSLAARAPFFVAFATPLFCQSRICGSVVEVTAEVARRLRRSPVRFIHVEVYEGNDPSKGENRWFRQWQLPTEPWVFLVDRTGVIRAKFEGAISLDELEAAVRRYLL